MTGLIPSRALLLMVSALWMAQTARADESPGVGSLARPDAHGRWQLTSGMRNHDSIGVRYYHGDPAFHRYRDAGASMRLLAPAFSARYRWSEHTDLYASYERRIALQTPGIMLDEAVLAQHASVWRLLATTGHAEVGFKADVGRRLTTSVALFHTANETPAARFGASPMLYAVPQPERRGGLSFALMAKWPHGFGMRMSYSFAHAWYGDASCILPCIAPARFGMTSRSSSWPEHAMDGELSWRYPKFGLSAAIGARYIGNGGGDDSVADVPRYVATNAQFGLEQRLGGWRIQEFARIDSVAARHASGGAHESDARGRFWVAAAGRSYTVGIKAGYSW
jgi:iron complex outermembrane receptor protein